MGYETKYTLFCWKIHSNKNIKTNSNSFKILIGLRFNIEKKRKEFAKRKRFALEMKQSYLKMLIKNFLTVLIQQKIFILSIFKRLLLSAFFAVYLIQNIFT